MLFDELKIGMSQDIEKVLIDEAEMLDFSKKYNPVPIHTNKKYAESTKFGRVIASGVMSFLSVWAKYVPNDYAGEHLLAGKSEKTEWFAPVFAGDTLFGKATITALTPRNEYNGILEITIEVCNQDGVRVLKNVTESIVRRK